MKPSYKLIGVHWYRYPIPVKMPQIVNNNCGMILDYTEPYTLMDYKVHRRRVKFSDILKLDTLEALERVRKQIADCDEIILDLDYMPSVNSIVLQNFVVKRVLQLFEFINSNCNSKCKVILYLSQNKNYTLECINHIYNKQYDQRTF